MTNLQLLLTIGIPGLLVVLSWISNNARLDRVDRRMDAFDKRFDEVDKRIDEVLASTNKRFDEVDKRIDDVLAFTNKRFDDVLASTNKRFDDVLAAGHKDALEIMRSMTALHERVAVVEARQGGQAAA